MNKRRILVAGGATAGWLTAAYLAKYLAPSERSHMEATVLESPDIGVIGLGEGTFPPIRTTLQFLDIDERRFLREPAATFKQGIRFVDWARTPAGGERHEFLHPFEAPFYTEGTSLVSYGLLQDEATRPPFAQALTIQQRVAEAMRARTAAHTEPLSYAYHFDAIKLASARRVQGRPLYRLHRHDRRDVPARRRDRGAREALQRADDGTLRKYRRLPQAALLREPACGAALARQRRRGVDPRAARRVPRAVEVPAPGRFDFMLDIETCALLNYQYILYGKGYLADMGAARADFTQGDEAEKLFAKIRRFGDRALVALPTKHINAVSARGAG
jgi:hypothetical protein